METRFPLFVVVFPAVIIVMLIIPTTEAEITKLYLIDTQLQVA